MLFNSRAVAIILALIVSVVVTAFLSLFKNISQNALIVAFLINFSCCFILAYLTFEFLIFREINNLYSMVDKIKKKDFKFSLRNFSGKLSPLQRINQEIFTFATKKQQEIDELKRLEVFRREFLADVSHELKTPLFAAQGYVHTLLDGALDDKSVREKFLKKAAKSLDGLEQLVSDLLTLSHMEAGQIKMQMRVFDLQEKVKDVIDELESKAKKRKVHVQLETKYPEPVLVLADSLRISQVLTNLIDNAIKYGNEEGHVSVEILPEKEDVIVSVKDDGPGIAQEHLPRIFERFYRIEKSRTKGMYGGTGLGLAIVKHICEAHNSKVLVTSKPNKGSAFTFRLSKAKVNEKVAATA